MRDKQLEGLKGRMIGRGERRASAYLRRYFAGLPRSRVRGTWKAKLAAGPASRRRQVAREKLHLLLSRGHLSAIEPCRQPCFVDYRSVSL